MQMQQCRRDDWAHSGANQNTANSQGTPPPQNAPLGSCLGGLFLPYLTFTLPTFKLPYSIADVKDQQTSSISFLTHVQTARSIEDINSLLHCYMNS